MTMKISALPPGSALTGTEQLEAVQAGSSVKITVSQLKTFDSQESISFRTVSTGFTETVGPTDDVMILSSGGTVGLGTIVMPASPVDGKVVHLSFGAPITGLTVNANVGQTLLGAPTTAAVGTPYAFVYRAANATWYRMV